MSFLFHNPRCSKSRQALALLEERGAEVEVIRYLDDPPDADTVSGLVDKLGIPAHDLLRTKEAPYAELGLSSESDRDTIVAAIARHPILLERPVLVVGDRAVIGRPPERVLELL
ncbi:MAG: arsenate reductase (glutaredoxin) [Acidobacteriota bacterium]